MIDKAAFNLRFAVRPDHRHFHFRTLASGPLSLAARRQLDRLANLGKAAKDFRLSNPRVANPVFQRFARRLVAWVQMTFNRLSHVMQWNRAAPHVGQRISPGGSAQVKVLALGHRIMNDVEPMSDHVGLKECHPFSPRHVWINAGFPGPLININMILETPHGVIIEPQSVFELLNGRWRNADRRHQRLSIVRLNKLFCESAVAFCPE